ncbi:MAG: hypothetical protein KF688_10130 [Pirellulales bacterium]|nr:hypothetical protein [Pirellulales bacterium]
MQIELSDNTYRELQALLAAQGAAVDVGTFVNQTMRRTLFLETARRIKQHNATIDPAVIEQAIDEVVDDVRADRRE